jgi:hypothetical protein
LELHGYMGRDPPPIFLKAEFLERLDGVPYRPPYRE